MPGTIKCPQCKAEIPLNEVVDHEVHEQLRSRLAAELADRDQAHSVALAERERELTTRFEQLQAESGEIAARQAEEAVATELADLRSTLETKEASLKAARKRELALLQERRQLAEEREGLDLEIARRLDDERKSVAANARAEMAETHQLEVRQKDIELEQLRRQIKRLEESSHQTRPGLHGEALEREIEDVLREQFPHDLIEPIKAGVRGADVLQSVHYRGTSCGKILWESKRARNFSQSWITKLKQDQAAANADFAVLVCSTMPANTRLMERLEGVWVVEASCVAALAGALRQTVALVSQARSIDANRNEAMATIHEYLSSNAFAHRLRTGVEIVVAMKSDLDGERRTSERRFSKRASQLEQLVLNTAGLYGELESLMGGALPAIELFELSAGEDPADRSAA